MKLHPLPHYAYANGVLHGAALGPLVFGAVYHSWWMTFAGLTMLFIGFTPMLMARVRSGR